VKQTKFAPHEPFSFLTHKRHKANRNPAAQQSLGVLSFLSEAREFMIILILVLLGRI
jgi:hypothetical protein